MNRLQGFKEDLTHELRENILPYWIEKMQDSTDGFYGRIDGEGKLHADAERGAIMYGRILWTFSAAYRLFGVEEYLSTATRAYNYLIENFYDKDHGGIYWALNSKGEAVDTKKQFYALGFAIYGLSEYYRITRDEQALEYAIELFNAIEKHSYDPKYGGYFEAATRTWEEIADMRLSDKDANEKKTMNTHLHILEPYTNLYRVWKDDRLKKQLTGLIDIFLDKIESEQTHHLGLFFDERWTEKSVGNYSYGHDIEASWLLLEAALETGDPEVITRTKTHCKKIAAAAMEGYQFDGSMAYERHADGRVDTERHWWVQAETVVGLFYLYRYYDDTDALDMALMTWDYIKKNLVDVKDGEWFWSILPDGTVNRRDDKAGFWKCPYHNGRMCMEIISLIK